MTSAARQEKVAPEVALLDTLRDHYEAKGFSFEVVQKDQSVAPFLGEYIPDAIARKAGENVAIEIRQRRNRATGFTLRDIQRRFSGHPDWTFVVAYTGDDPLKTLLIQTSSKSEIRDRLTKIRTLDAQGEHRAAFILGWALLEAMLLSLESEPSARPRTPGTVVQTLAMLGFIDSGLEQQLRSLVVLRNRIVHGDLAADASSDEVGVVLKAIEAALSEA